jgi:Domain of unknown function (DUF4136)
MRGRNILRMRIISFLAGLLVCTLTLLSDEQSVDFDHHTDFSTIKTFALHEGKVNSPRPELNNALVLGKIGDAIRSALVAKGLKETKSNPDVLVDYGITGEDFSETRGGPAAFSQGTLVIDLVKRDPKILVWRGVYRDNEKNNAKLAQKLPDDVKKTLAQYPPRQKGSIEPRPVTEPVKRDATPQTAANAILDLINTTRQDTAYVGGSVHPGLAVSLNNLERVASAVATDDGRDSTMLTNKTRSLAKAIQDTIDFAMSLADRTNETANSKAKSRDLAAKLRSFLSQ